MNNQEMLQALLDLPADQEPDDLMLPLMEHIDALLEDEYNVPNLGVTLGVQLKPGAPDCPGLRSFIQQFELANPRMSFWFCLLPFRQFIPQYWPEHQKLHDQKVRAEYPEARWHRLYCCDL